MAKTLEEGAGLTPQQKQLLDLAVQEPYFTENFYLTGGTALSSWYLHHRESFDLDFFSTQPFNYDTIKDWFRANQIKIGYRYSRFEEDYSFYTVMLRYPNDNFLKIDFGRYSRSKLSPGIQWHNLEIDSLRDITANKLDTIATNPRTRDFIDLYYIYKLKPSPLKDLISDVFQKFQENIDPLALQKTFLKVREYTDFPKMLVPFDFPKMIKFYDSLARGLKKEIFK